MPPLSGWRSAARSSRPLSLSPRRAARAPAGRACRSPSSAPATAARCSQPRPLSQPWLTEAVGTAEWTGTPLAPLLDEAGVRPRRRRGAVHRASTAASRAARAQAYERSLPLADIEQALLAYEMNGAPLPPQHGFPLRLVVPGWYGMTNVKWLARITLLEEPFEGYQNAVAYRLYDADGEPGEPVTRMLPRSLMVPPGVPDFMTRERHLEPGPVTADGPRLVGLRADRARRGVDRRRRELRGRRAGRAARRGRLARLALRLGRARRASTCCARARPTPPATPAARAAPGTSRATRTTRSSASPCWSGRLDCAPACASSAASSPPAASTSATTSGRSAATWRARSARDPAIYCIVDLHATSVAYDPGALPGYVLDTTAMLIAAGLDPRALHPVPPVRRARAHRAHLAALLGHRLRRPPAHAPVQGEVGARAGAGAHQPVPLPGAPGGRHPALPDRRGAGRRRPAPAHRARARDRAPLQRHLRRGAGGARARDPGGRRADHGPAGPDARRCRPPTAPRPAWSTSTTSPTRSAASSGAPRPTPAARWSARPTSRASRT